MRCVDLLLVKLVLSLALTGTAFAGPITYDLSTNVPTLFENVSVDFGSGPELYDVSATWGLTFAQSYDSTSDPDLIAWGDSAKAQAAIDALIGELTADGYAGATGGFQLLMPYAQPNFFSVAFTTLDSFPLTGHLGSASGSSVGGWLHWTAAPEPGPALLWLPTAALSGLTLWRRRRAP